MESLVKSLREELPFFKDGYVYLDSASTSLTPKLVIDAMIEYYKEYRANIGRGVYYAAKFATYAYEEAREKVAKFINAKPEEIIFVKNSTEAINIVARGLNFNREDNIVTTLLEHHSNYIIWLNIGKIRGCSIRIAGLDEEGNIDIESLISHVDKKTKIIAITQTSNVLGVKTPIKEIVKIAQENGSLVLVDGAQSVPHMKVDVRDLNCDFLAFSGHKMCGPTGIGVLYIKEGLQEHLEPLCIGGGVVEDVNLDDYILKKGPAKYEAGTPPIAEAIGLGAAISLLSNIGMDRIEAYEQILTEKLIEGLSKVEKIKLYGPRDASKRAGIVAFNVNEKDPHDVAVMLDERAKIMVRSGCHCALPLHKYVLKAPNGTVRASLYFYNTLDDVVKLIEALDKMINFFIS
ncbi:MAG: cysteine desulfurase [Candidatus Methanomethyliaceae archaeon]|nr:cysteine desulfurase [Candidatus Methanomethyliaceae archaeon]MDW7971140.1 cysteine desulfurase [Nitrososphaerota archaeon]